MKQSELPVSDKLELIERALDLTQTEAAAKIGVSFVAYNAWRNGRSEPRAKKLAAIDALYLEATGQKAVPLDVLSGKKALVTMRSKSHPRVLDEILRYPDIRDEFILKLTYNSNSIEGSSLSEPDTAAVLFGNTALPHKSLTEQLEAKNHQTALLHLFTYLKDGGRITETLVLKLHSILMNGVRHDAGLYRRHAVRIVGVNLGTANYVKLPELVPAVVRDAASKRKDAIAAAARVHARFEQIHPFSDGNGRVGRLILIAMLLSANLAPAIIRQERRREYYAHLYHAQTTEDTTKLEHFFCDCVLDGFDVLERRE